VILQGARVVFLVLGTALLPVYLFPSGSVQPAHLLLAGFMATTLASYGLPLNPWSMSLLAMSILAFAVDGFYVVQHGDSSSLVNAVFLLYNFFLASAVYSHVKRSGFVSLAIGVSASALIVLLALATAGIELRGDGSGGREAGTFNNPNQLGFYSVCLLSFGYLFHREGAAGRWYSLGIVGIALLMSIVSLSKAAMVANFVVLPFVLQSILRFRWYFFWGVVTVCALVLLTLYLQGELAEYLFVQRLGGMVSEEDSSLAARGYYALQGASGLQLLFGLGTRGVLDVVGHEVHSTLASALSNYGVVGLLLFASALLIWAYYLLRDHGVFGLLSVAAPAMLYGLTHNGARFAIFWVLFAASMAATHSRQVATAASPVET
jgi:hypothetical protein